MSAYSLLVDQLAEKDTRSNVWKALRTPDAIPDLINGLLHHSDDSVRFACAQLLAKIEDPQIDAALLQAMQHDTSWKVQGQCVKAIGNIEDDDVVAVVVDLLIKGIPQAADRLRKGPQSHKTIALLNQRLEAAPTPEARQPFMDALMRLASPETYDQYIEWLTHSAPDYRFQAAMAVDRHAYVADPDQKQAAYERLLALIPNETDLTAQVRMVESLGGRQQQFDQRAFALLTDFLQHPQEEIVQAARHALKATGYDPDDKSLRCSVCGKSQPERKVEACKICGAPVCQDHWRQDPMRYHKFCSEAHEQQFTKAQGIDYWK